MNILLSIAIALAAGLAVSRLIRLIHLPNVTAFLIAGLLIGPSVLGILTEEATLALDSFTTVALGFIAYSIGGEFKLSYLKEIGVRPIVITLFEGLTAAVAVFGVMWALGFDLALCLALGAIATATAPAATLMVVRQYKAKGPVCATLLPVVAMDDALCLMCFSICSAIAAALTSGQEMSAWVMLGKPLLEIVGALALGTAIGFVEIICSRFFRSRGNKLALSIACVMLGVGLCEMWGLSSLLVCMMIGAVMINLASDRSVLVEQCDRFTPPLFLLFFVLSGANLDLSILPQVGLLGAVYLLSRAAGKWAGASIGASLTKCEPNVRKYLGLTLLPQAGVAIGMAHMSSTVLPAYGPQINAVVLCATLLYELVGPVITKVALTRAGEISGERA